MKKIAVIAALPSEVQPLLKKCETNFIKNKNEEYINYEIGKAKLYIFICGMGKVHSGIETLLFLQNIQPDIVIHCGTCGLLNDSLEMGDVIFPKQVFQSDTICLFNGKKINLSLINKKIITHEKYYNIGKTVFGKSIIYNDVLTGDTLLLDSEEKSRLFEVFCKKCGGYDMESYSVAAACNRMNIPVVIFRIIIDSCCGKPVNDIEIDFRKNHTVKEFVNTVYKKLPVNKNYNDYIGKLNKIVYDYIDFIDLGE